MNHETEQLMDSKPEHETQAALQAATELNITGMTCPNCARHVTEAIQSVPGVRSATVSLEANQASVRWAAGAAQDVPAVIRAVEEAGYGASVAEARRTSRQRTDWAAGSSTCGWASSAPRR